MILAGQINKIRENPDLDWSIVIVWRKQIHFLHDRNPEGKNNLSTEITGQPQQREPFGPWLCLSCHLIFANTPNRWLGASRDTPGRPEADITEARFLPTPATTSPLKPSFIKMFLTCSNSLRLCIWTGGPFSVSWRGKSAADSRKQAVTHKVASSFVNYTIKLNNSANMFIFYRKQIQTETELIYKQSD